MPFVPFGARAWQAGISEYQGRPECLDYSLGIKLAGTATPPYEESQYRTLTAVIAALLACYATLDATRIVGHSDIAPGRKLDPGVKFDWPHLKRLLAQSAAAPIVAP